MKQIITALLIIVCFIVMMTSTDFNNSHSANVAQIKKQHCFGYTVIEAGKGIDCYGDTVNLVKRYGFYEIASRNKSEKIKQLVLN